jgi:hypothetical protein
MAKAQVFRRCVRCVAVRKIRKWLTAAQRPRRRIKRAREMAKAKVSERCVRCVAVREIRMWLTAAQRPQRRMKRVREVAKAQVFRRCVHCVAVRDFQNVAHGGTATTARNQRSQERGTLKHINL